MKFNATQEIRTIASLLNCKVTGNLEQVVSGINEIHMVEVGDIVELDNGSIYGTVRHFGGRYTLVEATDGKEIMIPNEEFIINNYIRDII